MSNHSSPPTSQSCPVENGIETYLDDLIRRARMLTRHVIDAEELVQDTVERALRYRDNYRHDSHVRAWLMRIMHNLFISQRRRCMVERRVRSETGVDPNSWVSKTVQLPEVGLSRPLERAMGELPKRLSDVVRLVDLCEYSYQEAAAEQEIPIGTVMSRLHRGRNRLKNRLMQSSVDDGASRQGGTSERSFSPAA